MGGIDDVHGGDVGGGGLRVVQATAEEQAAIRGLLSRLAESAPPAAGVGRAPALAWAGLRLASMVLLAAGVVAGYADGDDLDEVGCTVAQKPGRAAHGKTDTLKAEMLRSEGGGQGPEHPTSNIQHRATSVGEEGKAEEGLQTTDYETTDLAAKYGARPSRKQGRD